MGNRITNYIKNHNITMEQLADGIGTSEEELELVLTNNEPIDSLLYYKVCKFLNVSFELFIEG